tara:strand:+ start:1104 stop:1226 length:123 start_codon:yes stop_codon:yes gene_type:complete
MFIAFLSAKLSLTCVISTAILGASGEGSTATLVALTTTLV